MTTRDDLVSKLLFAAENTQGCLYSQRKMLKDAATALEAANAEIARLTEQLNRVARVDNSFAKQLSTAMAKNADLGRQLAEERERCARVAETLPMGMFNHPQAIAAAIRGGEK